MPQNLQRQVDKEVAPWFYRCRYCGRWKDSGAFSSGQVQWASESDFSKRPRRGRREPVCRGCAGFALHLERGVSETEVAGSLPLESRFALIMTFSGEYPGLPEFNEDILRCIFSFLMVRVAPFVADVGDGTFRCTVCMRDFTSLPNVMQHIETSKRHVCPSCMHQVS
ncbi:unnamed protein product [Symbiodinium necroappetens]|uniref:C2H2-type domain-containing protein n=1 Tax=Symbiodinium necroappetens TaxID=1628268 RepID=A0A812ZCT1_9DINO|nr:unnamed protein product [Symbiodinium necroappetens]